MSVDLAIEHFLSASPAMLDWGGSMVPALGGQEQRVNRLGSRFMLAMVVDFDTDEEARKFLQRLRRGKQEGAMMRFPQIGLTTGSPGSPLVDGAVAGGTTLPLKGLTPNYAIREGQYFSIIHSSRRYLYSAAAQAIADAAGEASVTIHPTLRVALSDNDVVEIARPMIEGVVDGDQVQWEHAALAHEPIQFAIREMG